MDFQHSERARELQERIAGFMDRHIYPAEHLYDEQTAGAGRYDNPPIVEELKAKAREEGLWNLFLPASHGAGLTNLEYAPLAEIMGRVEWALRGVQLLGAGHRQHGSAGAVRHAGAEGAAGSSRCWPARSARPSR